MKVVLRLDVRHTTTPPMSKSRILRESAVVIVCDCGSGSGRIVRYIVGFSPRGITVIAVAGGEVELGCSRLPSWGRPRGRGPT